MSLNKSKYQAYLVTCRYNESLEFFYKKIEVALKNGISIIQLREKNIAFEKFVKIAQEVKLICNKYNVDLIINDNVLVAKEVLASGVHIGQNDLDIIYARKILGKDAIIGVSVSNLKEAILAQNSGANYIGVGSIFPTKTKLDAKNVSFETLHQILDKVTIDVVVIGGINFENINKFKNLDISGFATVSLILKHNNLQDVANQTKKKVEKIKLLKG